MSHLGQRQGTPSIFWPSFALLGYLQGLRPPLLTEGPRAPHWIYCGESKGELSGRQ